MRNRCRVTLAAVFGLALLLGFASVGGAQSTSPAAPATPAADTGEYVGMDTCVACHEEVVTAFKNTPHRASSQGCEGCHGPGKDHVEAAATRRRSRDFKDLSSVDVVHGLHALPQQGRAEALDGLDPRQPPRRLLSSAKSAPRRRASRCPHRCSARRR